MQTISDEAPICIWCERPAIPLELKPRRRWRLSVVPLGFGGTMTLLIIIGACGNEDALGVGLILAIFSGPVMFFYWAVWAYQKHHRPHPLLGLLASLLCIWPWLLLAFTILRG